MARQHSWCAASAFRHGRVNPSSRGHLEVPASHLAGTAPLADGPQQSSAEHFSSTNWLRLHSTPLLSALRPGFPSDSSHRGLLPAPLSNVFVHGPVQLAASNSNSIRNNLKHHGNPSEEPSQAMKACAKLRLLREICNLLAVSSLLGLQALLPVATRNIAEQTLGPRLWRKANEHGT